MNKTGKRVLWLHPCPEHYFNCMMDALEDASDYSYIAAFAARGAGTYKEVPVPQRAQHLFLRTKGAGDAANVFSVRHADWRGDLLPLNFDAVIISGYAGATQRALLRHCAARGIPIAMFSDSNLRSQRGASLKWRLKRAIKKRVLAPIIRHVNTLLTANTLGVAYWRYYGAPLQKIHVCPYYADYARVDTARSSERNTVLASHGLSAEDKLIVTAARLVPVKGLHLMIHAFRHLQLAGKGWRYCIAGTGPLEAELKALAGDPHDSGIRFLGFQQPSALLALIHHAHLFAFPSTYEPHGIVVQESLAAETPVLSSNASGAAHDLVIPGESGWLFRSGDQEDLSRVLADATGDAPRLAAMRASARRTFEDWFSRLNPVVVVDRLAHGFLASREATAGDRGRA